MGYSVFGASNSLQIIYYRRCKACKKNFCVNIDNIRSHTYTQVILFFSNIPIGFESISSIIKPLENLNYPMSPL